ncbi:MAG: hypothetical protein QX197_00615 [Methylococcaceae bacterium]
MKKLRHKIQYSIALAGLLLLYNSSTYALSIVQTPFNKIPITAVKPSLQDILKPILIATPITSSCSKIYPAPELFYTGKSEGTVGGVDYIYYSLAINNKEAYPDSLFAASSSLPPCGLNTSASRTWAQIYDQNENYLYGFCALSSGSQLDGLWFAQKKTDPAPGMVHVILKDRLCNKEYKSAPVSLVDVSVASDAPVIEGIGLVPKTFINQTNGLATTGAGHPINVKDAPFGNSLRFIGNLDRLRGLGITRYAIGYCDMESYACGPLFGTGFNLTEWKFVDDVRTNYFWNATLGKYVLQQESPTEIFNDGTNIYKTYPVPSASLNWYFDNLLFDWVTQGTVKVPSGLYKMHLFGFNGPTLANIISVSPSDSTMVVRVDNTPPNISINSISYKSSPVSSCSIVNLDNAADSIEFNITANDPDGYLLNYNVRGEYGDNQTLSCVAKDYASYLAAGSAGPKWSGVSATNQSCSGFPQSCAYSYHISGWDRAIDGYQNIHYVDYFKTLTIQVPSRLILTTPTIPLLIGKKLDACGK